MNFEFGAHTFEISIRDRSPSYLDEDNVDLEISIFRIGVT